MNTVDIRDMNKTQGVFWMIALPLTLVTLSLILFVAYSGDGLKERFTGIFSRKRRNQERYASRAMISFADMKEKSGGPDLIDMTGSSDAGERHDRLFSWRRPQEPNPFLANPYDAPPYDAPPSATLPTRLEHRSGARARGRGETLPPYELAAQPFPVRLLYVSECLLTALVRSTLRRPPTAHTRH
jgi:hypothetical protein